MMSAKIRPMCKDDVEWVSDRITGIAFRMFSLGNLLPVAFKLLES